MLIILETKMKEHASLSDELGFDSQIQAAAKRLMGGIVIMWNDEDLKLDNLSISTQGTHVLVKVSKNHPPWLLFAIYTSNCLERRIALWENLTQISQSYKGNRFIGGDFNEIIHAKDKLGGRNINSNCAKLFWQCLNQCSMVDLGFKGSKYTWTNKRYSRKKYIIFERLARCFANES